MDPANATGQILLDSQDLARAVLSTDESGQAGRRALEQGPKRVWAEVGKEKPDCQSPGALCDIFSSASAKLFPEFLQG